MSENRQIRFGSGFLAAWIFYFSIWLAATASFETARIFTGGLLTIALAYLSSTRTAFWAGLNLDPRRIFAGLRYLGVFFREMLVSNLAVLRYVYSPTVAVSPQIIHLPVKARTSRARLALTNTLALTPGTLPIDLKDNDLEIHVLDSALVGGADDSVQTFETLLENAIG